jgi:hypothetical protein
MTYTFLIMFYNYKIQYKSNIKSGKIILPFQFFRSATGEKGGITEKVILFLYPHFHRYNLFHFPHKTVGAVSKSFALPPVSTWG